MIQPTVVSAASLPVSFIEGPVLLESSRWLAGLISTSPYILKSRNHAKVEKRERMKGGENRKGERNSKLDVSRFVKKNRSSTTHLCEVSPSACKASGDGNTALQTY